MSATAASGGHGVVKTTVRSRDSGSPSVFVAAKDIGASALPRTAGHKEIMMIYKSGRGGEGELQEARLQATELTSH
ncbi:hypothetical protein E2C01_058847 [Portunus trituberculatus]|uniref:Uncharacterized protein n=1 Tax=Portunus trituberculatus TaxID=210409 RepID=A0A5B7H5U2_PORTR|nr:hypothetical protein [Portunus trituberculatus]